MWTPERQGASELRELWRRYKTDRGRARARAAGGGLLPRWSSTSPGAWAPGLPAHVEEADLISYGLIGLISAIERFDLDREIKFETYADHPHQGRDHRRAALAGLGAALRFP